ncbi:MAG: hypothetical protein MHM6MM_001674 [Cercozoa sp. M6MM]
MGGKDAQPFVEEQLLAHEKLLFFGEIPNVTIDSKGKPTSRSCAVTSHRFLLVREGGLISKNLSLALAEPIVRLRLLRLTNAIARLEFAPLPEMELMSQASSQLKQYFGSGSKTRYVDIEMASQEALCALLEPLVARLLVFTCDWPTRGGTESSPAPRLEMPQHVLEAFTASKHKYVSAVAASHHSRDSIDNGSGTPSATATGLATSSQGAFVELYIAACLAMGVPLSEQTEPDAPHHERTRSSLTAPVSVAGALPQEESTLVGNFGDSDVMHVGGGIATGDDVLARLRCIMSSGVNESSQRTLQLRQLLSGLDDKDTTTHCAALAFALRFSELFSGLCATGVPLGDDAASLLLGIVATNFQLSSLEMADVKAGKSAVVALAHALETPVGARHYELLDLSLCNMGDAGFKQLLRAIEASSSTVSQLHLNHCHISARSSWQAMAALSEPSRHPTFLPLLQTLEMDGNACNGKATAHLAHILGHCANLRHLSLSDCSMGASECDLVIKALTDNNKLMRQKLRSVDLSKNALAIPGTSRMRSRNDANEISFNHLLNLARVADKLECLALRQTGLDAECVARLLNALNDNASLQRRMQGLVSNNEEDKSNELDETRRIFADANDGMFTPVTMYATAGLTSQRGVTLDVSDNDNIAYKSPETQVAKNTVVTALSLQKCDLGRRGTIEWCEHLPQLHALVALDFSCNIKGTALLSLRGDDDGSLHGQDCLYALLMALPKNRSLAWVDVRGNRLGDSGYEMAASAVQHNNVLRVLRVDDNRPQSINALRVFRQAMLSSRTMLGDTPQNDMLAMASKNLQLQLEMRLGLDDMRKYFLQNRRNAAQELAAARASGEDIEDHMQQRQKGPQFGVDPADIFGTLRMPAYESRIPVVLCTILSAIVHKGGQSMEGIFRLAPDESESELLLQQLNDALVDAGSNTFDVMTLANALKVWFRDLPTRALQAVECDTMAAFVEAREKRRKGTQDGANPSSIGLEDAIALLEPVQEPMKSAVLWLLDVCAFCASFSETSRMSPYNLGVVFAPNLMDLEHKGMDPLRAVNFMDTIIKWFAAAVAARQIDESFGGPAHRCGVVTEAAAAADVRAQAVSQEQDAFELEADQDASGKKVIMLEAMIASMQRRHKEEVDRLMATIRKQQDMIEFLQQQPYGQHHEHYEQYEHCPEEDTPSVPPSATPLTPPTPPLLPKQQVLTPPPPPQTAFEG